MCRLSEGHTEGLKSLCREPESGLTKEHGTITRSGKWSIKIGGLLMYIKVSIFPIVSFFFFLLGFKCLMSGLKKDY